ncbi:MAG TPA: RND family transporter [Nitrospirales bacterium]|nr:RND family transporter [Nitrospirales bacterium]
MNHTRLDQAIAEWYAQRLLRFPWVFISASLLLFGLGAAGIPNTGFNASYRVFFGPDNPQLRAFDDFQAIYVQDDNVAVVIHHPNKPVFSNEVLASVRSLTAALWKTQYVTRVDSVTNYQHTQVMEDDLLVDDLISALPLTDESLHEKQQVALAEPSINGLLLSSDAEVTQVNARVLFPSLVENPNVASDIYGAVEQLVTHEQALHPDIDYRITGIVATNHAFAKTPENEMRTMLPIMIGLTILALALLVRSTWGVILPLFVVLFSIVFTLGVSGHFRILLTPVSLAFPQILLAIAIAYSVHIVVSYTRLRRAGSNREDAVRVTILKNLTPIFLTAVTTSIGFLSMTLNEVPPVQHLGILVGVGVLFTFVISVTFLPALLAVCPCGVKPMPATLSSAHPQQEWTVSLGRFVVENHRGLFYGLLFIVAGSSIFIARLELDNNPLNYFKIGTWHREATEFVDANLTGVTFTDYSLQSGQPNGITNPAFLAKVEAFTKYVSAIPEVAHVNSIVPVMKRLNKNLHADNPAYYQLPETQELAAQYLLLYTMSLPFGLDLTNQINVDYSSTRVTATMHKVSGKRHMEILDQVDGWVEANMPEVNTQGVGTWVMFTFLSQRVIHGMINSLMLALILITIVCVVTFRSLRLGLISLIPNALPILLTFGVWGMLGDHIDFAVSIVATAALGVIIDDTIHLLVRYQRGRENGKQRGQAFQHALHDVGHALLFTSIILVVGFGLFLLSDFRINSSMGAMISLSIAFALAFDFLCLPGILMKFDKKMANEGRSEAA